MCLKTAGPAPLVVSSVSSASGCSLEQSATLKQDWIGLQDLLL